MLKSAILSCFVIVLWLPVYAQKNIEPASNLKPKNYWGISIIPSLTEKTEINGDKTRYQLQSNSKIGAEILLHYHLNFSKNYSVVFSAGGNAFGSKLTYTIPKEMFDPPTTSDVSLNKFAARGLGISNNKIQIELLRRWVCSEVTNWNLGAGVSLLFSFNSGLSTTWDIIDYPNGQSKQYFTRLEQFNNNGKPWFNFHISGGHEWILKSKNIFQLNLKVNYSPINPATGTYLFTTGIQPDLSGNFGTSGSYIGVSIGYIFTRANKKKK